ncbi:MAG: MGMT family protein, partial [Bdellovibrionota bacterium]
SSIPYGETRTYGWVASRIKNPSANRAVGQALRSNPLPIIIPCHRIVSANSLGGFMGHTNPDDPELKLKQGLLALEGIYRQPLLPIFSRPLFNMPVFGIAARS